MLKSAVLIAFACVSYAVAEPLRNDLLVRFDMPKPLNTSDTSNTFISLPRTANIAMSMKFYPDFNQKSCVSTFGDVVFYGFRYQESSDNVMWMLYDTQGSIAGMQACWPLKQMFANASNNLNVNAISSYQVIIQGFEQFACQTAYFVKPETICNGGRSFNQVVAEGTAANLYFQWGKTPATLETVPLNRADAPAKKWSTNNCFLRMGRHNFYNVEGYTASQCTLVHGYFLLYNSDRQVTGWGFRTQGTIKSRFVEHPDEGAIKMIQGCAPQCIIDATNNWGTTTMHVYLTAAPGMTECGVSETYQLTKSRIVQNSLECLDSNGNYSPTGEDM